MDCFKAEPLAFRDEARKEELEVDESLETKEREEALGDTPGRCCEVMYGPKPVADLRGAGENDRLPGWDGAGEVEDWPSRPDHILIFNDLSVS